MREKDEMLDMLRNLPVERTAVRMMREDLVHIQEDMKKELPAVQRGALERERIQLQACLTATEHHISRVERLLALLDPDERRVLDHMIINPYPEVVFDLAKELNYETASIYRIRARALSKLIHLRYGAGEK